MLCPTCTAESGDGQLFCSHCGASLTPSMAAVAPLPPSRIIRGPLRVILCFVLLLAALLFALFVTSLQYNHQPSSEAIGYCVGLMLLPAFFAWLIAGRRSRRNGLAFFTWFFVFVFLGCFFSVHARHHHGLTDEPGPVMMQEMMGLKPLPADASEDDKQTVAATKATFADLRAIDDEYDRREDLLAPQLAIVDSAPTFANRPSMQRTLDAIAQKLALDQDAELKIEHMPDIIQAHLAQSALTDSEKQEFRDSIQSQLNSSDVMKARKAMLTAETEWAAAATSLYNFALLHSEAISVAGGAIHIANAAIRTEFNTQLRQAGKTRLAYNASLENVKRLHQQLVDSEGLTEADMGLKK
jgi:hypothetical protein